MKHFLALALAACSLQALAQSDKLPNAAVTTPIAGYLVNKTDTTNRQFWLNYGSRFSDRLVRYPELLRTSIVNQSYAKAYADSLNAAVFANGHTFYSPQTIMSPGQTGHLTDATNAGRSLQVVSNSIYNSSWITFQNSYTNNAYNFGIDSVGGKLDMYWQKYVASGPAPAARKLWDSGNLPAPATKSDVSDVYSTPHDWPAAQTFHTIGFGAAGQINDVVPSFDFDKIHYDGGNGYRLDNTTLQINDGNGNRHYFREIDGNLHLINQNNTDDIYFTQDANIVDRAGNYFLKGNSSAFTGKADTGNVIKRSVGVIHLGTIAQLQAYTGLATSFVVTAHGSGGVFNLEYQAGLVPDNFITFAATGKGAGYYYYRKHDEAQGINLMWNPTVVANSNYQTGTVGTDCYPAVQALINSYPKKNPHLFVPDTYPYCFAFSQKVNMGENFTIDGENSFFPKQYGSDTLKFAPKSMLWFYNGTNGFESQTTDAYRPQHPTFYKVSIVGSGKTGNTSGINLPRNNAYAGSNVNYRDLGLPRVSECYIDSWTTDINLNKSNDAWIDNCHLSNSQVGVRGGKNGTLLDNVDGFTLDTAFILKGVSNTVTRCLIEPGAAAGVGLVLDSAGTSIASHNRIYNSYKGILVKAGCYGNIIANNQFGNNLGGALNFMGASSDNQVNDNVFYNQVVTSITASSTTRLFINGNTFGAPLNSTHVAIALTDCTDYSLGLQNFSYYTQANQFSATGTSTAATQWAYNNSVIVGNDTYNTSPSVTGKRYGGTFAAPAAVSSGTNLMSVSGIAYDGSGTYNTANVRLKAAEAQTSTAHGSQIDLETTAAGTTTLKATVSVLSDALYLKQGTNTTKLYSGTAGSVSSFMVGSNDVNKGTQMDVLPNGTANFSTFGVRNASGSSFGSIRMAAVADTAFIYNQSISSPATPIAALNIGGTNTSLGGSALIPLINIRTSRLNLPSTTYAPQIIVNHFKGGSAAPTIAAGTGAGTGPTVSITGSDAAGEITITTGSSPVAQATLATITFNSAYGAAPYIVTQRSSPAAPTDMSLGSRTSTGFTLTGTLAASTTYKWNYIIVQ